MVLGAGVLDAAPEAGLGSGLSMSGSSEAVCGAMVAETELLSVWWSLWMAGEWVLLPAEWSMATEVDVSVADVPFDL